MRRRPPGYYVILASFYALLVSAAGQATGSSEGGSAVRAWHSHLVVAASMDLCFWLPSKNTGSISSFSAARECHCTKFLGARRLQPGPARAHHHQESHPQLGPLLPQILLHGLGGGARQ